MGKLCGIRAPRSAAGLLIRALLVGCWLVSPATPAVAEDGREAGPGGIRVLRGAEWSEDWCPPGADGSPAARGLGLKGVRWEDTSARPSGVRPAPAPDEAPAPAEPWAGESLLPPLDLLPVEHATPGEVWANLFERRGDAGRDARSDSAPVAPRVTVLVLPAIFQAPSRPEAPGGSEACEVAAPAADETKAAARRPARAAAADEETAAPARPPEPIVGRRDPPYPSALAHFVSTAAAVLVALGLFCAGLLALRRLGVSLPFGPPPGPAIAAPAAPVPAASVPDLMTDFDTAPSFDVGPTFAEEERQRQQAAAEQEEAMLRSLFEQNVRLREQIGELTGASEPAP